MTERYDVRDYGAVGDGSNNDTTAVQEAIDACHAAGGGTVVLAAGVFPCSTIEIKSRVTLEIASGATLFGIDDIAAYGPAEPAEYKEIRYALVIARQAQDIGLVGAGTLDGNGAAFGEDARPQGIYLDRCTRVRVHDLCLRNAGAWMLHVQRCAEVSIRGLTIRSRVQLYNDGIDVDSSRNVRISDCDIESGDDAIALKTRQEEPCREITVTNCLIKSDWAAFRFGPESLGGFYNIAVSNCVVRETWGTGIKLQMAQGARMSDIVFSNIVMDSVTGPFSIRLSGWSAGSIVPPSNKNWKAGVLERITFSGIRATVAGYTDRRDMNWEDEKYASVTITGLPDMRVKDLVFSDIDISFPGGGKPEHAERTVLPDLPEEYPEYLVLGVPPAYALYMHHVDRIRFRGVTFRQRSADPRPAVVLHDCKEVEFSDGAFDISEGVDAVVRLSESPDTEFRSIRFGTGAGSEVRSVN